MKYDESNVSNKSQLKTLVYLLIFGKLGIHRFYVGKYITGLLFLLVGVTQAVLRFVKGPDFLSISVGLLSLFMFFVDIILIYTDKFTDKEGCFVLGAERIAIIEGEGDFEKLRFISKIDKFALILLIVAVNITSFLLKII